MRVTIADIAARAGVSKTTVSRVLNGRPDLDQGTAARVRAVIEKLDYVPSSGAVGLARGRTGVVGVLLPSVAWPWMGEVLQGVIDTIEAAAHGVMLFTCTRGDESMRRFSSQVSARSFDALVVIEPEGTLDYIAGLHVQGLPVVMIDDRGNHARPTSVFHSGFPSVATTNLEGAAAAARHLLERGRHHPVVLRGSMKYGCTSERLEGFAEIYATAGLPVDPARVVDGQFSIAGGRAAIHALLETASSFDAVFAHNDLSAAGALRGLRAAGLAVPRDVSVIGFDDVPLTEVTEPPLTSVHQPRREMGVAAAAMVLAHVNGSADGGTRQVIPTSLTIREST